MIAQFISHFKIVEHLSSTRMGTRYRNLARRCALSGFVLTRVYPAKVWGSGRLNRKLSLIQR